MEKERKPQHMVQCQGPERHWYDASLHSGCPYCGIALGAADETWGLYGSSGAAPDVAPTMAHGQKPPGPPAIDKPTVRAGLIPAPEDVGRAIDPVVGWLVCIDGPDRGRDFRIHPERNHIGRAPEMDIVIGGDERVSRRNHAVISYNPKRHGFSLAPGSSSGITYLNDEELLLPRPLTAYDIIEVGASRLLFVPFCGPRFTWQDGLGTAAPADPAT